MFIQTMTWEQLPQLYGKSIILFGTDKPAVDLLNHIRQHGYDITVQSVVDFDVKCSEFQGYPLQKLSCAQEERAFDSAIILIASTKPTVALNSCIDSSPREIWLCSQAFHRLFDPSGLKLRHDTAEKDTHPFFMQRGTPKVRSIITNAFLEPRVCTGQTTYEQVFEIADFHTQEFTTWSVPQTLFPLALKDFSGAIHQNTLPMRMSHLGYLMWKRDVHVAQLSYSRRFMVGVRYNYFHLDILDTHTGTVRQWHDLPPEQGLWDYVATGDFGDETSEEYFYFVRWPLQDAIDGMADGTNKVRCQVGRLNLETLTAEILREFEFQDRIHQCTVSGDGRYMVFAPMRVLLPKGDPRKIRQEDLMRNLQESVRLDSMATLDLHTGKVWYTEIPYPIPAHFEVDPQDTRVLFVSTHSLMPHAQGVLCFQPATLHKLRILDGETIIEGTYTHPSFVRTTQHCAFVWQGKTLLAATNQNRLEIIDTETMELWHCYRLFDDPLYDNANFNDPEFIKKPFNLPPIPDHCNSISASGDGRHLLLRMKDHYKVFDMEQRAIVGNVLLRGKVGATTHCRYYMQNAPQASLERQYAGLWPATATHHGKG